MPSPRVRVSTRCSALPVLLGVLTCGCPETHSAGPTPPTATQTGAMPPEATGSRPTPPPLPDTFEGWTADPIGDGKVAIGYRHTRMARMEYVFFGPKWQWAGVRVRETPQENGDIAFTLETQGLPIQAQGTIRRVSDTQVKLTYALEVTRDLADISGVGLQVDLSLDVDAWPARSTPNLHTDGRGFTVEVGRGDALEYRIEGDHVRTYFERGNPATVRATFLSGNVAAGSYPIEVTIGLPKGGRVLPPIAARYGTNDTNGWHRDALVWNDWPIDTSALPLHERPAGKHGPITVRGDALVFADGTPARFWGTNLVAFTLFTGSKEDIANQAKRLAALGYNLVRIHHHDSHWTMNVFDKTAGTSQKLDAKALDALDWWIKCLEDEGIYVWVDLHVGRQFVAGDGIAGFEELERTQGLAKGFNYVNARIETLMEEFATQYLSRENRYTGKSWATDPGIVGVLVTNENDLLDHFGTMFLPDKGLTVHKLQFENIARTIAKDANLSLSQALRTWEPGAPKILLSAVQHRFDERAIAHLRKLGVTAPIATTNYWGSGGLWSLVPLLAGDVIDVHSYGEAESLGTNPHFEDNWVQFIAGTQAAGKPLTVSEWNVPSPNRDRFTASTYVAAIAALQGWDALMLYCYSQGPVMPPRGNDTFSTWTDPSFIAISPAAALMFRRGDVSPARKTYALSPTHDALFGKRRNAESSAAIRSLSEQSRVVVVAPPIPELPWAKTGPAPADASIVDDLDRDFLEPGTTQVVSDTGEIRRDWGSGVQTIDTPRSQIASGWIGGQRLETQSAVFEVKTPKALVALTALDDQPIETSSNVLVTVVARTLPTQDPGAAQQGQGGGSWLSEPVHGRFGIATREALTLTPLTPKARGETKGLVARPGVREGKYLVFEIPSDLATHWFVLRPGA